MPKKFSLTQREKDLIRRYLVWCYTTTKESLDKIDRYFIQYKVDSVLLDEFKRGKDYASSSADGDYKKLVREFEQYAQTKKVNAE